MIVFNPPIDNQKLRMAYNNDIMYLHSNSGLEPAYCTINALGLSVKLYPDPQGRFFFNFKPYVTALINTRNFEDNVVTDLDPSIPESFLYNSTQGTFLQRNVTFRIHFSDTSLESQNVLLSWLGAVEQVGSRAYYRVGDLLVLSPLQTNSANGYYLKYWQGYPFDIPFYTSGNSLKVQNETNLVQQTFSFIGYGTRLFLSDGRTDETLESLLPLAEGHNSLRLMKGQVETDADKFVTLQKVPYACGVYLKWLNSCGGYSYWLFEDTYTIDRSTKQIGELDYDLANVDAAYTRTLQIGKESRDSIKVLAELLTDDERTIVQGLLDSPKIYLFTGKPYSRANSNDWIEVALKTGNARLKNPKQPLTNFTFDLELPMRYTQTL